LATHANISTKAEKKAVRATQKALTEKRGVAAKDVDVILGGNTWAAGNADVRVGGKAGWPKYQPKGFFGRATAKSVRVGRTIVVGTSEPKVLLSGSWPTAARIRAMPEAAMSSLIKEGFSENDIFELVVPA